MARGLNAFATAERYSGNALNQEFGKIVRKINSALGRDALLR